MSPQVFVLSTVVPAIVMGLFWLFANKKQSLQPLIPIVQFVCFGWGIVYLTGFPRIQWPMDLLGILVFVSMWAALIELFFAQRAAKGLATVMTLLAFGFAFVLRGRMVASEIWSPSNSLLPAITFFVFSALTFPASLVVRFKETCATRITLILTGTALSIIFLLSGSALLAQILGLIVALITATVVCQLVLFNQQKMPPFGVLSLIVFITSGLLLGYFFVEVPKRPLLGICLSLFLAPLASGGQQTTSVSRIVRGVGMSLPALISAGYVIMAQLQESAAEPSY